MSPPRKRAPGAGRKPLPPGRARSAGEVKVALRADELERLDAVRGGMSRAEYVRQYGVPVPAPAPAELTNLGGYGWGEPVGPVHPNCLRVTSADPATKA